MRLVKEAEIKRKEKDLRIAAERKANGVPDEVHEDDPSGWNKGTIRQPEIREDGFNKREQPREEFFGRAGFGKGEVV